MSNTLDIETGKQLSHARHILLAALVILSQLPAIAQSSIPTARLVPAPTLRLAGDVDSNSPAIWERVEGEQVLHVLTSIAGQPSVSSGTRLSRLGVPETVGILSPPGHGVWMEAVVADEGGTWYGYYHNEIPAEECGRPDRTIPRIGAARSADFGRTWENLGIVLEAPTGGEVCDSPNQYFAGGVGDLSVMLDSDSTTLYLFFSQYSRDPSAQGVAVARLLWANRDRPVGRVEVWSDGVWLPPLASVDASGALVGTGWTYPPGTPLVTPEHPWHDADEETDAFWGASVHWNGSLGQYVMLLNRTRDERFTQEGVYVSFSPVLDDPTAWSPPVRILEGGSWYPQVMGLTLGEGTDKAAGSVARFFMGGTSSYVIEFSRESR